MKFNPSGRSARRLIHITFHLIAFAHLVTTVHAQERMVITLAQDKPNGAATPSATVSRASNINIDGALTESEWAQAAAIGDILQREPKPGEAATEQTIVKLLYDDHNLYIGAICYDSAPDRIIATQMARDGDLSADDRVEILIDTFHDRRNAFYFATNPLGALVDALVIENGQTNRDWNAIWHVRAQKFDRGWSAEFAIPFKSLSFNRGSRTWGFNFSRSIKRKFEEGRWAAARLDVNFFQVSEAGEIHGLEEARQGRGLDVRPYLSGKWTRDHLADTRDRDFNGGVDLFYNITPSLKWTSTINTDFAETEVDNRQINLTRFPLFFPEKRAFFLENAGVFNFSNTGSDLLPFFSRRIGLLAGREVPILFGTKLTGKVDRYDVGILGARTRETDFIDAKNFFVARIKRNLFEQSYLGGIYTEGDPSRPTSSRTLGADLRLATSRFLGGERNFQIDAFAVKTFNEGSEDKDLAYGFSVNYPNDLWDLELGWRQIEDNFRPALGFVPRPGVRRLNLGVEFKPRPKNFLSVRQMFHEFFFNRFTRLDTHRVESWRLFTAPVNWRFNSGDRVEFNYVAQFERLFQPFEIADGVVIPAGDYRFTRWRAEFGTSSKRRVKVDGTWWFGSFYSGHSDEVEVEVQFKLAPHFQMSLETEQTFARLREGNFVARVFGLRADYSVSPFLTFFNLVQYDNESRDLGWQSRVRWILRPGNEVFLVFNQGWIRQQDGSFRSARTGLAGKVQYTFRF
jgi:hypothetical protein